jgi:hypothetical protein
VVIFGSGLLLLFAAACSAPDGEVVSEGEYLVFEPIGMGQRGVVADTVNASHWVLRSESAWLAAQDSLSPLGPFKPVDFDQAMVVVIALPATNGGYSIEVASVERHSDRITVDYVISEPSMDCLPVVGAALPFQAVRVRKDDLPVEFVERRESYRCTWEH